MSNYRLCRLSRLARWSMGVFFLCNFFTSSSFQSKKKTPSKNAVFAWKDFHVEALLILHKAKHAAVFYRKNIPAADVVAASERRLSSPPPAFPSSGRYSNCSTPGPSILLDSLSFSLPDAAAALIPPRRLPATQLGAVGVK